MLAKESKELVQKTGLKEQFEALAAKLRQDHQLRYLVLSAALSREFSEEVLRKTTTLAGRRVPQLENLSSDLALLQKHSEELLRGVEEKQTRTGNYDPHEAGLKLLAEMMTAEGGAWTGQELETRFRLTSATLHRRRKEHRIVSWRNALHHFYYPKWQFTASGALLPGIQDILEKFRSSDEWRVMRYFLAPRDQLGNRTPLDLLRRGEVEEALAHATAHGKENTW